MPLHIHFLVVPPFSNHSFEIKMTYVTSDSRVFKLDPVHTDSSYAFMGRPNQFPRMGSQVRHFDLDGKVTRWQSEVS